MGVERLEISGSDRLRENTHSNSNAEKWMLYTGRETSLRTRGTVVEDNFTFLPGLDTL
jgi:hypothetical protein